MFLILAAVSLAVLALGHPVGAVIATNRRRMRPQPHEDLPLNLLLIALSIGFGVIVLTVMTALATAVLKLLDFDPALFLPDQIGIPPWAQQFAVGGVILGVAICVAGVLAAAGARSAAARLS